MRVRTVLAAAAAVATAAAVAPTAGAAPAAPKPPQVIDIAGDANGANAQGFEDTATMVPDNGTSSGPASYGPADILSVRYTSTIVKKKVTGYTVQLALGGAPSSAVTYRVESTSPFCASLWYEYRVDPSGAAKTGVRCASSDAAATYVVPAAKVSGSTITWTVPLAALGKNYKAGTLLEGLGAQTRGFIWFGGQTVPLPVLGNTTGLTVPQLDHATSTGVFKIGQ
jgi:hypothetical protein